MKKVVQVLGMWAVVLALTPMWAQQLPDAPAPSPDRPPAQSPQRPAQTPPDAPSAVKKTFPGPDATVPSQPAPGTQASPSGSQQQPSEPPFKVKTVPPGSVPTGAGSGTDQLYKFTTGVNYVVVPVTVKDSRDHLVDGLTAKNFTVLENGEPQKLAFFTSDPLAISAAVVIDTGLPDVALKKIQQTFPALTGAFSPFDEIAVYTYGNTVSQRQNFLAALSERTNATLSKIKTLEGGPSGPAISDSPMTAGPSVNGRPMDPGSPRPITNNHAYDTSTVLNDAILQAAVDLGQRDRTRRKVIFVISDGREYGSTASYSDVLKVLLSNNVIVYAVAVDSAAIPGYGRLNRIKLPHQGFGNILPKYANATGGDMLTEFSTDAIERAYAKLTDEARNQYTLGYYSAPVTVQNAGIYRSIEVQVRGSSNWKVYAKDGYYPLPPRKETR